MVTMSEASLLIDNAVSSAMVSMSSQIQATASSTLAAAGSNAAVALNATLRDEQNGYTSLQLFQEVTSRVLFEDAANNTYLSITNAQTNYATLSQVSTLSSQASTQAATVSRLVAAVSQGAAFPSCPAPQDPQNGRVSRHVEIIPGTTVSYSCGPGWRLNGSATRLCLSNGSYLQPAPNCAPCPPSWVNIPCSMGDFRDYRGGATNFGRDIRSGNPGQSSSVRLPDVNIQTGGIVGIRFSYQYVVGYGRCGNSCNYQGPDMSVWLVDAANESAAVRVWQTSSSLQGYDYDTCGSNGGWGNDQNPNDGCYSPQSPVDLSLNNVLPQSSRVYVQFRFQNNRRNLHLNDDGMNMQIRAYNC